MERVVVGTAGHIDHGKTALVRALTGIDCDRLPEERSRGITIDLGFAHAVWDDVRFGFVDVPGHERFVRNMLAGAAGLDLALLVVAADQGIEPQTREHFQICRLLGISTGVVALTRIDRADPELAELVRLELAGLLDGSFLSEADIVATSAVTGEGVEELRAALVRAAARLGTSSRRAQPARLPVDRAFVVKGFGPVVTGTLVAGRIEAGDRLQLYPGDREVRVRGIQVHGEERLEAVAGERTSLNLAAVELGELERGQTLAARGSLRLVRRPTVELELLAEEKRPLAHGTRLRFHVGTAEVRGRLALPGRREVLPGESALAQVRLEEPVAVRAGDRFVLRSFSPVATLGGGRILDPAFPRITARHLGQGDLEDVLRSGSLEARVERLVERAGIRGVVFDELIPRLAAPEEQVDRVVMGLVGSGRIEQLGSVLLWPHVLRELVASGQRLLAEAATADRTAVALPLGEFRQRVLGRLPAVAQTVLDRWSKEKVFPIDQERVLLPGRGGGLPKEESAAADRILAVYDRAGLAPPSPGAVASELGMKPQIVQGLVRFLLDRGQLVKLPGDLIVGRQAVDDVVAKLRGLGEETLDVARFKQLFGLTRKMAIPLLEHLDQKRVTLRQGDRRRILPQG